MDRPKGWHHLREPNRNRALYAMCGPQAYILLLIALTGYKLVQNMALESRFLAILLLLDKALQAFHFLGLRIREYLVVK